ncbi:MAG: dipeptide epimerase [Bryobacteraceae bacterium]|nr:dipeptide epimerase [Bryobacteraceae bacterium]
MLRRHFSALPLAAAAPTPASTMKAEVFRVQLRHTWTTTMSSSAYRDVLYTRFTRDGITGWGEGAPIVRYNETAAQGAQTLAQMTDFFARANPRQYTKLLADFAKRVPGQYAMKAAVDIACFDWLGQRLGIPVHQIFGLDPADAPVTTFSIGIDSPEVTRAKVREAAAYPVLKVKVGLSTDEATIEAVRAETKKPLRVDANEGWKTKEEAVRKINWLEKQGVELIEQPLPAAMLDDMNWIRQRIHIPVIADEACLHPEDIPKLAPHFDGVNVKVDKCGGLLEALRMIQIAKSLGLKTMLGCMVSSSVAITAAAQLSPLVDYADLDGNLLISNDPCSGVKVVAGKLSLPTRPGLGLIRT